MRFLALALWAAITGILTLRSSAESASAFAACVLCGETGMSDFLLNVGLFVPLGGLLISPRRSLWWVLIIGSAVSVLIELLQLGFVGGRTVSPGDVLANGSGAFIGALLVRHAATLAAPTSMARRQLVAAWSGCVAAVLWAGWWTSLPWFPEGQWYLQRTPSREWSDDHTGTLHFAGIGSTDLASDVIRDKSLVRAVRAGEQDFTIRETPGPAPRRLSYTARLVEATTGLPMATFGRRGDALVVGRNHNAARARLSSLGILIPDAYGGLRDDSVSLRMNLASGAVAVQSRTGTQLYTLPAPSPLRAWSWFWPTHRDLSVRQRTLADGAWAVLLLLPFVWWWRAKPSAISRASTPASGHALH